MFSENFNLLFRKLKFKFILSPWILVLVPSSLGYFLVMLFIKFVYSCFIVFLWLVSNDFHFTSVVAINLSVKFD